MGDVHGKFNEYYNLLRMYPDTIQVGDMCVGFYYPGGIPYDNPPLLKMQQMNGRFIRGNHDNPEECKKHPQWIADGLIEDGVMFVGGAFSIDRDFRDEGLNWWPDEEISYDDMLRILDIYERNKPRVMVTHDGPEFMLNYYLSHHWRITTRTGQFFDRLFELHQPEIWIHGHHHISFDNVVKGTRFIVLAELEHKFIEID